MDLWTKDQVERMKEIGNVKSNTLYNPNETRHPPPANLMEMERDSELETYIRSKYEFKRFLPKYGAQKLGPSQSTSSESSKGTGRPASTPLTTSASSSSTSTTNATRQPPTQNSNRLAAVPVSSTSQAQTVPQPMPSTSQPPPRQAQHPPPVNGTSQQPAGVWADLVSLQAPAQNSSLPLQIQVPPPPHLTGPQSSFGGGVGTYPTGTPFQQPQQFTGTPYIQQTPFSATSFPQQQQPAMFSAGPMGMASYTPATPSFTQQQPSYISQQHLQPISTTPTHYLHPQPHHAAMQLRTGQQPGFMSAPPGQHHFMTSSPAMQPFTTPQPPPLQAQSVNYPGNPSSQIPMQGAGAGMGVGMGMGGGQARYLMTTPQPQVQQTGYYMAQQPQMVPGAQYGGFQGPMQPQSFQTSAYTAAGGQQWGAL
jgi:stromal membrane-associated protein